VNVWGGHRTGGLTSGGDCPGGGECPTFTAYMPSF